MTLIAENSALYCELWRWLSMVSVKLVAWQLRSWAIYSYSFALQCGKA